MRQPWPRGKYPREFIFAQLLNEISKDFVNMRDPIRTRQVITTVLSKLLTTQVNTYSTEVPPGPNPLRATVQASCGFNTRIESRLTLLLSSLYLL